MRNQVKVTLLAISMGLSSSVMANGFYVGGNVGYNKMAIDESRTYQENKTVGGLQFGYLHTIQNNFSIGGEFGVDSLGKINPGLSNDNEIDRSAMNLQVVGKYAISNANVFAKAGGTKQFGQLKNQRNEYIIEDSKIAPIAGLGVGYSVTENFELTTEYSHVFGKKYNRDNKTDKAITQDTVKIGVNYHF